jgi:serine/threonine-protein kinase
MDFALKVFEPAFDDGAAAPLERFFREARILLMLNHPNIVRVFDAGLIKGKPFIRMELLEGKNLSEFLRDHGPMPLPKAATLVRKVLEALAHAHDDAKVCHRDLKPSNVMVAPGERVKVVDFGMGAFVEQELVSRLTRTGEHLVGGYFSAPELVQNPKIVDARADIYSVGAMWFNVVTGRPPAGTDVVEQLKAVPKITDRYRLGISKALASVEKRFQSASDMLAEVKVIEKQWATEGLIGWLGRE